MNKDSQYDFIERHLRQELTPEEVRYMDKLLAEDAMFAREVMLHKDIHYAVSDKNLLAFRKTVQEVAADYEKNTTDGSLSRIRKYPMWLKAAAVITLLLFLTAVFVLLRSSSISNDQLFQSYFEPYYVPANFRGPVTSNVDAWHQAVLCYNSEEYDKAISFFNPVIEEQPSHALAHLLRGISYLATNSVDAAQQDFQNIIDHTDPLFEQQAQWYLALCCLKTDQLERAIDILDMLRKKQLTEGREEQLYQQLKNRVN